MKVTFDIYYMLTAKEIHFSQFTISSGTKLGSFYSDIILNQFFFVIKASAESD